MPLPVWAAVHAIPRFAGKWLRFLTRALPGLENNALPGDTERCPGTGRCRSPPRPAAPPRLSKLAPSLPSASTRLEGDQRREPAPGLTFQRSPANGKKKKTKTQTQPSEKPSGSKRGTRGERGGERLCRRRRHFAPKLPPSPGRATAVSNKSPDPPQRGFFFPPPKRRIALCFPTPFKGLGWGIIKLAA